MKAIATALCLCVVVGSVFLGGCANYATLQTADVMEEGTGSFGAGLTFTKYQFGIDDPLDTTDNDPTSITVPAVNLMYRYGLTKRFELHTQVWMPLGFSAGGKFQLVGSPTETGLAASLGLDVGYLSISTDEVKTSMLDLYVPIYTGIDVTEAFSLYLTPRYVARILFVTDGDTQVANILTGTLGIKLGKKVAFMIEGTGGYDALVEAPVLNFGVGLGF